MKERFIDNNDGTITDAVTGLMWEGNQNPEKMTWREAIEYCKSLRLAGYEDWRSPSIEDLRTLYEKRNPTVGLWGGLRTLGQRIANILLGKAAADYDLALGLRDMMIGYYWSSTTYVYYSPGRAWNPYFYLDHDHGAYESYRYYARAVRGKRNE